MRDRVFANEVQTVREDAALAFARAGGEALRAGELAPALDDPVFVAFLALLREEKEALHVAVAALVREGARVAPVLEAVLRRGGHDPRKLVRLLACTDASRARALPADLAAFDAETQRALAWLAPELLGAAELPAFLEGAALAPDGSVRREALDRLLLLAPPAGVGPARVLLDPARFGVEDFRRAAQLLARAGELEPLLEYATIRVPEDRSEAAATLRALREACRAALRGAPAEAADAAAARLLAADTQDARRLGIELARDFDRLRGSLGDPELGREASRRMLDGFGREGLDAVRASRTIWVNEFVRAAARLGDVATLVDVARDQAPEAALRELARLESIGPEHEEALLALHRDAPPERRDAALAALVPLGTAKVRDLFAARGADAIAILAARSESGQPLRFAVPLLALIAGADDRLLSRLGLVALAQPAGEPGVVVALLDAWEKKAPLDEGQGHADESAAEQRARLVAGLAQSQDAESAAILFGRLVRGEVADPTLVFGILEAAVRHVPRERLADLLPLLREQARAARPIGEKEPPPASALRDRILVGGMRALACAGVDAGAAFACEMLLDPSLQPAAFGHATGQWMLAKALDALRLHASAVVGPALRAAIAAAEEDGRLARMEPAHLFWLVQQCEGGRDVGRRPDEVALALCEVLERLPFDGDVGVEKVKALFGSGRYAEAAAAADAEAARRRALGITARNDFWTPERLSGRALLTRALAAGEPQAFRDAMPAIRDDPYLCYLAGWYLLFIVPDLALAEEAAARAVALTGGLQHAYRDLLAAVRNAQGRPDEALELVDRLKRLPVDRSTPSGFHHLFEAKAHALKGDDHRARLALEAALADRRTLGYAKADRAFAAYEDVFRTTEEVFLF
jgi:hypothetical protein